AFVEEHRVVTEKSVSQVNNRFADKADGVSRNVDRRANQGADTPEGAFDDTPAAAAAAAAAATAATAVAASTEAEGFRVILHLDSFARSESFRDFVRGI